MTEKYHVVAVNGSPHEGFGNTSQMLTMLGRICPGGPGTGGDFPESIPDRLLHRLRHLPGIRLLLGPGRLQLGGPYRPGGRCRYPGLPGLYLQCYRPDEDLPGPVPGIWPPPPGRLEARAGLERLRRPRRNLAADYLGQVLRLFGAFPVGKFTAIAVGPGEFLGREAVEARAADLARDLARAVKEGRRYPATDPGLAVLALYEHPDQRKPGFYGGRLRALAGTGLFKSFETYVGQTRSKAAMGEIPARASRKHQQEAPETAANPRRIPIPASPAPPGSFWP